MVNLVRIFYAALPDENVDESASQTFAIRARQRIVSSYKEGTVTVEVEPLHEESANIDRNKDDLCILLISCGSDGSINRSVRKFGKQLKNCGVDKGFEHYAVGLLGHSVCKTSAEQMKDEVYGGGRRILKVLKGLQKDHVANTTARLESLETQVELVGPEDSFDPWIEKVIQKYIL